MHEIHAAPLHFRQRRIGRRLHRAGRPRAEYFFNLRHHFCRREISHHHQQRVSGTVVMLVVLLELFDAVARHLLFGRRNRAVRVRAKQDAPQALAGQKARRGALDAQALDELAPLAFEFVGGKGSLLRQLRDEPQADRSKSPPARRKKSRWCRLQRPKKDPSPSASGPPRSRGWCASCVPVRATVAVMSARPGAFAAATALPLRKKSSPVNFGIVCDSTRTTSRPFESVLCTRGGQITGRAGVSGGTADGVSERGAEAIRPPLSSPAGEWRSSGCDASKVCARRTARPRE